MHTTIETLFERIRRDGDAGALAAVFDRTAGELGRVAGYLAAGNREAAADLLQATLVSAIAHTATWDKARPLLPWLSRPNRLRPANARRSQSTIARRIPPPLARAS